MEMKKDGSNSGSEWIWEASRQVKRLKMWDSEASRSDVSRLVSIAAQRDLFVHRIVKLRHY